jgi:uncharacterized membrane protein YhhN
VKADNVWNVVIVLLAMTCVATTGELTVSENVPVAVAFEASVTVTV